LQRGKKSILLYNVELTGRAIEAKEKAIYNNKRPISSILENPFSHRETLTTFERSDIRTNHTTNGKFLLKDILSAFPFSLFFLPFDQSALMRRYAYTLIRNAHAT